MKYLISCCSFLCLALTGMAQVIIQKDPVIEKMVAEVNADSLKADILQLVGFGTRHTLSTADPKKGIGAAREWILSRFRDFSKNSEGRMTVEADKWVLPADKNRVDVTAEVGNAMAILHGTDTADKRIFIISGHMDSRVSDVMNRSSDAPGANDDGSGTAAVLECARVMSRHAFPATIIFVAVCGEEQGLLGSDHLAERAKQNNWDIEGVLNNDIMGSNQSSETHIIDNTRIRVFSEGLPYFELDKNAQNIRTMGLENDGRARQLARYVREMGERYVANLEVVLVYRNDRFLRGGDHSSFVQRGYTAVRITEMNENYEHQHQDVRMEKDIQYGDLASFMDFEYLRKNTALNLACLANLAKSPPPPLALKMDVQRLGNSTWLYWKAPKTGRPKGYYVLMRETYQALWQKKFFTSGTEMRLPYSKDNYFFAVQSVGEDGNEGLPVVPSIGR
ncbi:MAG TPA: M20/M25/M40 family metallo-hydrolase [Puia sp.]|nr:M20/M25/M40 family metallo-hydrolase [Puia sp.]